MSSCNRFSVLMKVDLPQPEGPISAVTDFFGNAMFTPSSTLRLPNHTLMSRASISAGAASADDADATPASNSSMLSMVSTPSYSAADMRTPTSSTRRDRDRADERREQHGHEHDEDEGGRPGPRDGIRIRERHVVEDVGRNRRDRAAERVDDGLVVAAGGEQQRRRLADDAGDAEDHRGDDARLGSGQDDAEDGARPRGAQGERSGAEVLGHQLQDLLGGAGDGRQHEDGVGEATGERALLERTRGHDDGEDEQARHD